jgi:hypothetical protein
MKRVERSARRWRPGGGEAVGLSVAGSASLNRLGLRMKTERKYPKPTVFVFYIMIPFLNIKNYQFQLVSQPFSTLFCIL